MQQNNLDDERLMQIVESATTLPIEDQPNFIHEACGGDRELEERVAKYVKWKRLMGDFLADPAYRFIENEEQFQPGQVLLKRFRIIREVGRGGMGIAYEAFDETLQKRVALKCAHSGFDRQLIPEVRHAGEISHPNVCKIFDIHHEVVGGDEISFISMEFLNGPTLSERLDHGAIPEAEAKRIALELCRGLQAAHRNHVIHGDFKSNNVILARSPEGGERAVITDFGLARHGEGGQPGMQSGPRGGAPVFMAPELRQGGRPSIASDIYALGMVLYHLATGRLPEDRKKRKAPPKWGPLIARALEADPVRRYQNAGEIARSLDPAPQSIYAAGAAAAILYLLVGVPQDSREHIRLAILPLSTTGIEAPLAGQLNSEIREKVAQLKGDADKKVTILPKELGRTGVTTIAGAAGAGATHVLTGSLEARDGGYVLRSAIVEAASGVPAKEFEGTYTDGELRAAPVAMAGVTTSALHLPPLVTRSTVNAAAREDYELGLRLVRRNSQVDPALAAFERAVQADPDSPLTHAGMAEACWLKNFVSRDQRWLDCASDSVRRAERLNPDLPEVHRIAGLLFYSASDYEHAVIRYERALEIDPTHGSTYRRMGLAYDRNNRKDEALRALLKAVELEPQYFKNHQQLGVYYDAQANYAESLKHFRRAAELEPGDPGVHYAVGSALLNLNLPDQAETEFRTSLSLGESVNSNHALGLLLMYQGRDSEAIPYFRRAIALQEEGEPYVFLGVACRRIGHLREAAEANRAGLRLLERQTASNPRNTYTRSMLAYFAAAVGERNRAESEAAQVATPLLQNEKTKYYLVLTYETLRQRDRTLALLRGLKPGMIDSVARWPDLADLHQDPRFMELAAKALSKETK